jgi:hypothetical protein
MHNPIDDDVLLVRVVFEHHRHEMFDTVDRAPGVEKLAVRGMGKSRWIALGGGIFGQSMKFAG